MQIIASLYHFLGRVAHPAVFGFDIECLAVRKDGAVVDDFVVHSLRVYEGIVPSWLSSINSLRPLPAPGIAQPVAA